MTGIAPYPFSFDPAKRLVLNEPSEYGAQCGAKLATMAEEGESLIDPEQAKCEPVCTDCAFRRGTNPNRSAATVADAFKCAIEGEPFWCHKGIIASELPKSISLAILQEQVQAEPKRVCGGWVRARLAFLRTASRIAAAILGDIEGSTVSLFDLNENEYPVKVAFAYLFPGHERALKYVPE